MKIERHVSLLDKNTFHIDACCDIWVNIESIDDVRCAGFAEFLGEQPRYILGQGSNVLVLNDLTVPVIHLATLGWQLFETDDTHVNVTVQGGQDWHEFVLAMAEQGLWGIENLALIPGTVGAAPIQNIGAYGVELSDVFVQAQVLDLWTGEVSIFDHEQCAFAYRHSVFKAHNQQLKNGQGSRYLILDVTLRLSKVAKPVLRYGDLKQRVAEHLSVDADELGSFCDSISDQSSSASGVSACNISPMDVAASVIAIRQQKLPNWHELGCAGSFFKNPVVDAALYAHLKQVHPTMPAYPNGERFKVPAGWLIEQAGWKGFRDGDAGVYDKQALVLVNHGAASGQDIAHLAERICASVEQQFGIALEQEVITLV